MSFAIVGVEAGSLSDYLDDNGKQHRFPSLQIVTTNEYIIRNRSSLREKYKAL